ncbi:oxidoreductase [Fusarium proliferatum]|uniref:Oxidoreductase n=1 Tax=Gibberella intermedia TaxID=948311 RepID=A0A365MMB6_GIBIN|nr:oxidoreductase [Fusarium proliferatum]
MSQSKVDLSNFVNGQHQGRHKAARQIYESLRQHGFVILENHGLTNEDVSKIFEYSRAFFNLPLIVKDTVLHRAGPTPQRGWSKVGDEDSSALYRNGFLGQGKVEGLSEFREHFDMDSGRDGTFQNKFPDPDALPGFQDSMMKTFAAMEIICQQILEALEVAMGLEAGLFRDMCTQSASASEFRMTRYPPIPKASIETGKDGVGGLEFQDRDAGAGERFKPVACDRSTDLIVNVSETLQRWTNDHLRAGLHRVVAPAGDKRGGDLDILPERFSVAYFCKADKNVNVGPLAPFLLAEPAKYKDITALEYHQQRLASAYS